MTQDERWTARSKNFPNDIMAYPFEFDMKDIGDLI